MITEKFILDEYYLNRAGDKVKYVGLLQPEEERSEHARLPLYMFRKNNHVLYGVYENGEYMPANAWLAAGPRERGEDIIV